MARKKSKDSMITSGVTLQGQGYLSAFEKARKELGDRSKASTFAYMIEWYLDEFYPELTNPRIVPVRESRESEINLGVAA